MDIIPAEQSGRIEPEVEHSEPITAKPDQQSWDTLEERWADPPGVIGWFRALQNDAVGGRIMATAFLFFLMAGLLAILMRFQLISPESTLIGPEMYNRFFTMHGSTMMYLFVV
ncbi:MAG: cbb3-type cytochrome c oxidase subunit I, partial [Anaerolineales bacterium]|nr:cbb3-type cytochrome c oxidase subunit I [Anaerolineales bacterium]